MSYNGNFSNNFGYGNMPPPSIQRFEPNMSTFLNSSANEFTPSNFSLKSLNALATDFQPAPKKEPVKPNLKADAPIFEMSKPSTLPFTEKLPILVQDYIPESIPEEKIEEPIFFIQNRELTEEDMNLALVEEFVKVDVRHVYSIEEISNIYKEMRQNPLFEKVSDNIRTISTRKVQNCRVKNNKKGKESMKNKEWRDPEEIEIVSVTVWRKPKTEEEEKIMQKAKMYKAKLTGTKEEHEKIKRKIKITLNKLSPTNLEKLQEQLFESGKESTNNLILLVQCIFEKAWSEVKYTQTYASLCKYLKEKFEGFIFPELENEESFVVKKNLFKHELLDRCQHCFTSTPSEEFEGLSKEEIEEKKSAIKKKTLGNVRFIGELFKVELITSKTVLNCINELINKENFDEDKIEGACILLSTGGNNFERTKLVKNTDKIFKELEQIMNIDGISTKNKFKIMDVIDERSNHWKKNFKEEVKTVQEIHQEFEKESKKRYNQF